MNTQKTLLASAILAAISSIAHADTASADPQGAGAQGTGQVQQVVVTANPFRSAEGDQILTPAKVLQGDELRDKAGSSLGETLSQELGVSASAFGAGASRPIIRGMEGPRVKMLENGMAVSDVSGLSNDHAVAAEGAVARQIEILRGPAALLYGSGAIGGLVNVVNERIPTTLEPKPTGQAEARYSTVDTGKNASGTLDGSVGKFALHADGNWRNADDYKIPGTRTAGDPDSGSGRLANSFTRERNAGIGGSYVGDWGYAGASVSHLTNLYGIPSAEGSRIDQEQTRYDIEALVRAPFAGFENLKFKAGHTSYEHAELGENDAPEVVFDNRSTETRVELSHLPVAGWRGTFGLQTENTHFSALSAEGGPDTVPVTRSTSQAGFLVEEKDLGPVRLSAGGRLEHVKRQPITGLDRSFDLKSGSVGAQWPFMQGYAAGLTYSYAQRAPATEELYSHGPHDATVTFDIGNPDFRKEVSRNVELSVQKTNGLVRWKANLYRNKVDDFIYGNVTGMLVDEEGNPGEELRERIFEQANATIRGAEAELTVNEHGAGWSGRLFADTSRGKLDAGGSLPLQPADRVGASVAYKMDALRAGLSLVHARGQDRLASFEGTPTDSYNQLNANLSYTQKAGAYDLTYFLLAKNLLNDEIRVSTSVLKDIAPLAGRGIVFGVRAKF
ncbi:TonB-dependent receptor [Pseudoduganella umbonata]|uniref:Iron complex outermembrane receptor protein n=1 Tax=Pseudoduganella umbonata TaxID=864828 RepID=A0A4P8HUH3_9BURK|nr:TonB-dependent receptor [Pseudoduganella umbonata]MBB3220380.1 iron complex outermembrane receptor protein [Pseudoduganella umbonata]QCP12085.1 TonB-dependent receptor [Pseudoduganella umbonata]